MFIDYKTALFAIYLFLIGDSSALSNWSYKNNPSLVILIVLFSFLIVIYLMNLLIGLLNIEIDKNNNRVSYLVLKAKILAEIELLYLFPYQKCNKTWFPEVIYYYANVDEIQRKIKEISNKWNDSNNSDFLKVRKNLKELITYDIE
uniref:Ion transport domain-containing protein n=1 Tax=Rhizophagus irregularis (strain DAOM 181602 / DAOM 197198 / MUCL 43194) TaxID=747089 RepID=U9THH9_RHIID